MNTNCLENMACPKCGSTGPYMISCECVAEVDDNGIIETRGSEWTSDSSCTCKKCGHDAKVRDFYIYDEETEDEDPSLKKNRLLIIVNDGQVESYFADHPENLNVACIRTDFDRRYYDVKDIIQVPCAGGTASMEAVGYIGGEPTPACLEKSGIDVDEVFRQLETK
ncbi:MAG: hypothetical protein PHT38_01060 [Halothiobacillus sp.]|nr:hypothetical protein [Halothiobacillus sp.]